MIHSLLSIAPNILALVPANCSKGFFGLPPWYKYLQVDGSTCEIIDFKLLGSGADSGLILIGLAVVEMLLRIAGLVAVTFVLWGGFTYIISQAEPDKLANARHTILNALIGLGIALLATSIVVFVGNRLAP